MKKAASIAWRGVAAAAVLLVPTLASLTAPAYAQLAPIEGANCGFANYRCTGGETIGTINDVLETYISAALLLLQVVAVAYLLYAGFLYVTSGGDESRARAAKMQILYAGIGILVINAAELIFGAFTGSVQDTLRLNQRLWAIVDFVGSFVTIAATFYLIYAGFQYITSGGDEGRARTAKMQIAYAVVGIIVARLATFIVASVDTREPGLVTGQLDILAQAALGLLVTVSALYLIYAGYLYITSRGETEEANRAKRQITFAVIGIIVALSAYALAGAVRFGTAEGITAEVVDILGPVIDVAQLLAGIVAVIYLLYAGFRYITSQGDTSTAEEARRQILYAVIGLIIIGLAFPIAQAVLDGNVTDIVQEIKDIIAEALFLVGIVAVIYLIFAGMLYITSGGDEEQSRRARRQILYAVIGILVIGLSLFIVNVVISAVTGT